MFGFSSSLDKSQARWSLHLLGVKTLQAGLCSRRKVLAKSTRLISCPPTPQLLVCTFFGLHGDLAISRVRNGLSHWGGKCFRVNWSSAYSLMILMSMCGQPQGPASYFPFGNVLGKRSLHLVESGHLLLQQKASQVALLLIVCSCFLAPEPRGCPEILSHSVGMSESPAGPKPTMLRADMPTAPSFQRAFTSSCTISGNSPSQRRGR